MFGNRVALIAAALLLGGCASHPAKVDMPKTVEVPVTKYISIPAELTKPCAVTHVASRTVADLVIAYNANVTALDECNGRMGRIRALQPSQGK